MSNDYYNASTTITRFARGVSSIVNGILASIAAAFDLLPGKAELNQDRVTFVTAGGSANALTVTMPTTGTISAYTAGLRLSVLLTATNTGAATINVDGVGAKSIKLFNGTDPAAGDLTSGDVALMVYDGTNFVLVNPPRSVASGLSSLSANLTFTGNNSFTGTNAFSAIDVNGGAIDGTAIGGTSPNTGVFTTLTSKANNPTFTFTDEDGSSKSTRIRTNNAFNIDKIDDVSFTLVSTMYSIPYDASGATAHIWSTVETERARLNATGLGIGTTSPSAMLDVVGNTELNGNLALSGFLELDGTSIGGEEITIANDAVGSFTPPKKGGFALVTFDAETDNPFGTLSCLIWYDVGTSRKMEKNSGFPTVGGTLLNVTTSDVTGTTGSVGSVLISSQPNVVKVENREGSSHNVQLTWL